LPIFAGSESIAGMKARSTFPCLSLATFTFTAAFSIVATAQEKAATPEESLAPAVRLFVSDKLVLNVYAEPGQSGERVATIETGDAVDELERADSFVRIRLEDGREGWVGGAYLTTAPPAAARLRELQREQKASAPAVDRKSAEEIARLRKQNAALEGELKQLQASLAGAPAPVALPEAEDEFEKAQNESQSVPVNQSAAGSGALWIGLLAALGAGSAAFAAGYQTLARRIRKKFGGLKIY
jgi:uncharacterized protein YgiM (DUF1202 family)